MSKKKDYLPTHDHFYGAFAKNSKNYLEEIYEKTNVPSLYREACTKNVSSIEKCHSQDYSFEVGSKSKGLWDLVIKCHSSGIKRERERKVVTDDSLNKDFKVEEKEKEVNCDFAFCLEYKTSVEESKINELLRQIQNRNVPSYLKKHDTYTHTPIQVLVTFDSRFEKYRPVIENENISLVILDEDKISEIKEEFDLSDSGGKESDLNSFQ